MTAAIYATQQPSFRGGGEPVPPEGPLTADNSLTTVDTSLITVDER